MLKKKVYIIVIKVSDMHVSSFSLKQFFFWCTIRTNSIFIMPLLSLEMRFKKKKYRWEILRGKKRSV